MPHGAEIQLLRGTVSWRAQEHQPLRSAGLSAGTHARRLPSLILLASMAGRRFQGAAVSQVNPRSCRIFARARDLPKPEHQSDLLSLCQEAGTGDVSAESALRYAVAMEDHAGSSIWIGMGFLWPLLLDARA